MNSLAIVTVVKNSTAELIKTAQSIAQSLGTLLNFELNWIIINGGEKISYSISDLKKISHCQSLTLVQEHNLGIYGAMNLGISLVKNDYFIVLNAGDKFLPNAGKILQRHESNLVECYDSIWHDNENNNIVRKRKIRPRLGIMPNHQGMIFPISFKNYVYDEKFKVSADQDMKLRLWRQKKLRLNSAYLISSLHGGISSRKMSIMEIIQRTIETQKVFQKNLGNLNSIMLSVLYFIRYLTRINWNPRIKREN